MSRYLVYVEVGGFEGQYGENQPEEGSFTSVADSYDEALKQVLNYCEDVRNVDGIIIWPENEPWPHPVELPT